MRALALLIAIFTLNQAYAATLTGRVVGVHDGDSVRVLDAERTQHKIRLSGIDAPELKQAFGTRSRQNLSGLLFGKEVAVERAKRDRYKRIVGKVSIDETGADCAFRSCLKSLDAGPATDSGRAGVTLQSL